VCNARPESLLSRRWDFSRWGWAGLGLGAGDNAVTMGLLHCRSNRWGSTRTGFELSSLLILPRVSPNVGKESAVCDLMGIMMSEGRRHVEAPEDWTLRHT
jgi:hypothetical protein